MAHHKHKNKHRHWHRGKEEEEWRKTNNKIRKTSKIKESTHDTQADSHSSR